MRHKKDRIHIPTNISEKALKHQNFVFWGPEPEWNPLLTTSETETELSKALSWYKAMVSPEQQRDYLIDYIKEKIPEKLDAAENISADRVHPTGALARIILKGANLPEKLITNLHAKIDELVIPQKEEEKIVISTPKVQRKDPELKKYIAMVDAMLDDFGMLPKLFPEASMADLLIKNGATARQVKEVHQHFSEKILEFTLVLKGEDPELVEGYSNISRKKIQKMYNWLTREASTEAVSLLPKRKKKKKTPKQTVKLLRYQSEDPDLKLRSIDPEDILGAQQLWIYHTENRKLGVFYAANEKGLDVNKSTIINYDEESSFSKTIRKPENIIPRIPTMGKVELKKLMDTINSVAQLIRPRLSNQVVLLRIIK